MGWSGGSEVCVDVWNAVRKAISVKQRPKLLAKVITALESQDWDCQNEIEDEWPEAKKALKIAIPDYGEDEEDYYE